MGEGRDLVNNLRKLHHPDQRVGGYRGRGSQLRMGRVGERWDILLESPARSSHRGPRRDKSAGQDLRGGTQTADSLTSRRRIL